MRLIHVVIGLERDQHMQSDMVASAAGGDEADYVKEAHDVVGGIHHPELLHRDEARPDGVT